GAGVLGSCPGGWAQLGTCRGSVAAQQVSSVVGMISRRGLALLLALLALGAAGALTLAGTDARAGTHQGPAARAVHALLEGTAEEARAAVPEDFAAVRGYHPVIIDD